MPWFVHAPGMPIVIQYPDEDYSPDITSFYDAMVLGDRTWAYFLGQDGDEGGVVVNYGSLHGISVTRELPDGWTGPVWESWIDDDISATDIYSTPEDADEEDAELLREIERKAAADAAGSDHVAITIVEKGC